MKTKIAIGVVGLLALVGCSPAQSVAAASSSAASSSTDDPYATPAPQVTSSPTTTAAPTTPVATMPAPATGTGDNVIPLTITGAHALTITYNGTNNFVVKTDDGDLLVNTIGAYSGTVLAGLNGTPTQLVITASGPWTIQEIPVALIPAKSGAVTGTGDDVFIYSSTNTSATFSCLTCKSNVVMRSLNVKSGSVDLLVNKIGAYTGTVFLGAGGKFVIIVKSDQAWSFST